MHMRRSVLRLFVFLALALCCLPLQAQFLPAKADSVESAILEQKRAIEVYLPQESEKDPAQRYETIYVLDGDWNAQLVVSTVAFLGKVGRMPPVIVVSVPNFIDAHGANSRDINFLPIVVDGNPKPGSAADFVSFLKTELIPYVDRHYPANGTNLLHGHSYGGVLAIYALLYEPALFDGYLILDPAMWWNDHALDKTIAARLPTLPTQGKAIYVAARSGRAYEGMGIATIEPIFKDKAPRDLHWSITAYADETHDSLKLKGTYDALKFAYQGYTQGTLELIPMAGIVLKDKPVYMTINGELLDLHYTNDGSVPTASSPNFDGSISVADPAKTTVKLISNRGIFDQVVPNHLKFGSALAPARQKASEKRDVWRYAYYASRAWPNLSYAKPFRSGEAQKLDFADVGQDDFAGTAERSFEVPADGYYVLAVDSPGKMRLAISGEQVIDNDGAKGHPQQAFIVPLRAGWYSLRVEFLRPSKTSDIDAFVFQCKDGEPKWWNNPLFDLSGASKR